MMRGIKFLTIVFSILLSFPVTHVYSMDLDTFCKKHTGVPYQDIIVHGKVVMTGTDLCEIRYNLIKPILDTFKGPFSVLDLGAAQGYFSFNIALDYSQSSCVMIDANTAYYGNHGDILYDLCLLNSGLNNVCYLNKKMSIRDLRILNKSEHFDLVLGFLVVHLMTDNLLEQAKIIRSLLNLGENLILEVSNNVSEQLFQHVIDLSRKMECEYLGEVTRHRLEYCPYHLHSCPCTGRFFWFRNKITRKTNISSSPIGITDQTFENFHGVYRPSNGLTPSQALGLE